MKILFDSNILIYALNKGSNYHKQAIKLFSSNPDICITEQNIIETYRMITSAHQFGKTVYTPTKAWNQLSVITNNLQVFYKTPQTLEILKELSLQYKIDSYQVYDAILVAIMIENGIKEIYTNNDKDFRRYKEIKVVNPF